MNWGRAAPFGGNVHDIVAPCPICRPPRARLRQNRKNNRDEPFALAAYIRIGVPLGVINCAKGYADSLLVSAIILRCKDDEPEQPQPFNQGPAEVMR